MAIVSSIIDRAKASSSGHAAEFGGGDANRAQASEVGAHGVDKLPFALPSIRYNSCMSSRTLATSVRGLHSVPHQPAQRQHAQPQGVNDAEFRRELDIPDDTLTRMGEGPYKAWLRAMFIGLERLAD